MNKLSYLLLADSVLLIHVMIVVFVVLGLVITLVGGLMKWQWVRDPWFRLCHLGCIGIIVMQAWAGAICPLTTLEMWLRSKAGDQVYSGSFIAHWLDSILYYELPSWVFTIAYSSFGGLVILSWYWVRPQSLISSRQTLPNNPPR